MDILIRMLMAVLKDRKHKKQRRVLSTVLAAVVVFMTTYSLILPAITLEESTAETTDGIFLESADVSEADPADDDVDPSGELLLTDDAREESAPASDGWEDGLIEDADWEENGELADIPDEPALTDTGDETEEAAETETGNVYAETEEATEDTTESEESVGEGETESELEEQYPEVELSDSTQYTQVKVYAPEGAFPEGTQMLLSDVEDDETIAAICDAALAENSLVQKVHAVDISFRNSRNEEIEPLLPIRVEMTAEKCAEVGSSSVSSSVVHVDDSGNATIVENAQKVEAEAEDEKDADKLEDVETIAFEAKEFSVYALVYTVDFHWEVDGQMYEFSLPGGGFISFSDLIEVLGVAKTGENDDVYLPGEVPGINDQDATGENGSAALTLDGVVVSEKTREFVADVKSVVFSSPELVDVSKVESETTVGGIKESRGLDVQYSAELTEEQIAEINAQTVVAGDWALISVQPFESTESLTVTMKTGEVFEIRVTDAQLKKTVKTASGETWEITITYDDSAEIPKDAELRVEEILPEDERYEQYYQQSLEKISVGEVPDTIEDESGSEMIDETAETASEEAATTTSYAHIFDIQIWAGDQQIEPASGSTVSVSIKLLDAPENEDTNLQVVHFGKDGLEVMELAENNDETKAGGTELNFVTDEFSVYAIVGTELVKDITLPGSDDIYEVTVTYGPDANIPDGSRLEVTGFDVTSDEYKEAYRHIFGEESDISPEMMALDISIIDPNGNNVEPEAPVQVSLKVKELPENISSTELKKNIVISHLKEVDGSIHVEQVATGSDVTIDERITTEFVVDSFSTFTINWNNWNGLQVSVVDTNGNSVGSNSTISIGNPEQVNIAPIITGYDFVKATIGSRNGTEIKRLRRFGYNWQYSLSDSGDTWHNVGYNQVYFVYERTDWVKVYVYVAAKDTSVTPNLEWKNNPEFLELLGISGDTVDGNGYFPVGEILLPSSFFNGKTTDKWSALIKSNEDWEAVLAALGVLDSSTLIYDLGIDYSQNRNNSVGDYLDQAIGDVNRGAGSQKTALFGWSGHSYGFADQTVQYHLDLRFQPNRVTFITGNNNNPPGLRDGTTVDVRAYIQGSPIQQPRNLVIPAGYRLVGYYNDPDFTTPWDKIGTPIMQDEIAYIKITPQENVILYYKPVPAGGGTVSLDAEGLNPETGTPAGSTATPNPGYEFVGWYADEECTQLLSTNATYVPTKNSGERWVDGTTYYAKFQEEAVTLRFIAEDHIHHVELVTDAGEVISVTGNNTKEMSVTINKILGPAVTVRGVAENGYVVKEWTINGGTGALTTSDEIETAITDDPNATSGKWTDRTYHVWAESPKSVKVKKQVEVVGTVKEQDVDLYVYFALKKKGEIDFLMKDGHIWVEKIQIVDGIPQEEFVQFDGLQSGTYEVWEVADENASSLRPGNIVITTDSGRRAIIAANIRTIHGDSTSNNVTVSDTQPTDGLTVINTYSHENETMEFTAKKQWYSEPNTVNQDDKADASPPAGAWASFTIYKKDSEDPIRTIRLDGTPDDDGEKSPWTAVFDGIPRVDDNGNEIQYEVRETSFSEKLNGNYYYAYKSSVENSGGSIKNAVLFGNINVYKQIEVQPRNDEMNALVAAAVGNLKIHVTGPHEYDETFTFKNVTDPYNPSLQITELPAGEYTLEEVGYEDLLTGRKWNPTLSWIKAGNSDEQSGKTSVTFEVATNGASNDSVDVRLKNDYTKYDIKATKVWDDQGMVGLDHPSVPITLYRIDADGNKTSVGTKYVPANAVGDNLTVSWANQEQQEQQYTYEVVEGAIDGYEQVSITGNMFNGFTVTNKVGAQLRIVKTDQSGNALEGATFRLSGGSINKSGLVSAIPDGGSEALIYENRSLPLGTYTLSETDPPAGYNSLPDNITITVAVENGQVLVTATMNGEAVPYSKLSQDNGVWTLQVTNDEGITLPSTGGPGTLLYTLSGILLMLGAALMYGFRMRRRERRLK